MIRADRPIWIASAAILVLGTLFLDRPLGRQIAEADVERDTASLAVERNIALVNDRSALAGRLALLSARIAGIEISGDATRAAAAFVHEAAQLGSTSGIRVTGFDGRPMAGVPGATQRRATEPPAAFTAVPIELSIQGTYAGIVTMVRRLSHGRVPVDVTILSIERAAGPDAQREPLLDARLRVELLLPARALAADASRS
jgi:hypothetical protein